jgi:hypothetical protein
MLCSDTLVYVSAFTEYENMTDSLSSASPNCLGDDLAYSYLYAAAFQVVDSHTP